MLQIKNLTLTHKRDIRDLIKDFSLTVNKGDKIALIGEEGNGKSTLLKFIYDYSLVKDYIDYSGEIIRNNLKLGYLSQELDESEKSKTIYEFCSSHSGFYDTTPKELSHISNQLGLNMEMFYSEQTINSLSGGEKVKLQLACILIESPDILLLDEPSNDIDIQTLKWLENFIISSKIPVLYISHDETLLENTANVIVHIEQIRRKTQPKITVAGCDYKTYVSTRLYNISKQEQIANKERADYAKQQEKFRRIEQRVEHEQNVITRQNPHMGRLLKKKMKAVKSQEKRFQKEFENFTEIPDTEDAIFIKFSNNINLNNNKKILEYHKDKLLIGDRILAKDISLEVIGSKKVCVIGRNGVGKSTMLNEIAEILLKRKDINAYYMPQNYEDLLDFEKTPVEFLTTTGSKEENIKICTYLGSMKYTADEMQHKIKDLSGGQKAKLFFLKMILQNYNVLILDEPTRNFSPLSNPVIRKILKDFNGAIISISHDRKYIKEVCTDIYELSFEGLKKINNL